MLTRAVGIDNESFGNLVACFDSKQQKLHFSSRLADDKLTGFINEPYSF